MTERAVFRRSTLALLVAFLPFAFSEDILGFTAEQSGTPIPSGPGLVALDLGLYLIIAWIFWPVGKFNHPCRSRQLFAASLVINTVIDVLAWFGAFRPVPPWGALGATALYMIPLTLLFQSIAVAREHGQPTNKGGIWAVGGPLLLGTLITWVLGIVFWPGLQSAAVGYENVQGEYFAPPRVNQEYFAQVTQLLPVLLIALAVELRFFRDASTAPSGARQARTAVVSGIVGAGVLAAVLALPRQDGESVRLDNLSLWAEYLAWVLTINAVSVAVVALIWALAADRAEPTLSIAPSRATDD